MRVFITGGTGYIGSAVVRALRESGHDVSGLARSDVAARKLEALGAQPVRGDLHDLDVLAAAAREADGTIHVAYTNDANAPAADVAATESLLAALRGSARPLIYTSGVWVLGDTHGSLADEDWPLDPNPLVVHRVSLEQQVLSGAARGIRTSVLRPGMVYGRRAGYVSEMVTSAREKKPIEIVGDGRNHWTTVHVDDLAALYVLALERAPSGTLLLATNEGGVSVGELARAAVEGAATRVPVVTVPIDEARETLGASADAMAADQLATSRRARTLLGWRPISPPAVDVLKDGG
jgi:nucleoside-diphosphate-sugar epimerase